MATENGNGTVTVVKGDSLWGIASKYYKQYGYSSIISYQQYLVELNKIPNANIIYVDQVIKLSSNATGGSSSGSTTNTSSSMVEITHFGLIASGSDGLFVAWKWDREHTKEYKVRWYRSWDLKGVAPYDEQTVTQKYASYSPPSEVVNSANGKVSVSILPISETYEEKIKDGNGKEQTVERNWWTVKWSTVTDDVRYYYGKRAPTDIPSAPSLEIEENKLTVVIDDVPTDIPQVEFQVSKLINNHVVDEHWKVGTANVTATYTASYFWPVDLGYEYRARCRYINANGAGEWSPWSGEGGTRPSPSSGITVCRAISETEVFLQWEMGSNAKTYEIEYTTNMDYFDSSGEVRSITGIIGCSYFITGLESGDEYFFRVRAVNDNGVSEWTSAKSITIGTEPAAPTTWSSTTTVISGEELTLYWVHNTEDGSAQTRAEIELTINGSTTTETIYTASEEDDEKTMHYILDTTGFLEGATILWRVRTAGATGECGDWSIQRKVIVYAQPTLSLNLTSMLTSFPLRITGDAGPNTQTPVGYHISIVSDDYYETLDYMGNDVIVGKGEEIYSKYIDASDQLSVKLSAGDIDLQNNAKYIVTVVVSMDSGLTAEDSRTFTVAWTDELYEPNAEIGYDNNTYSMTIRPFCKDSDEKLVENVTLSVYRREFNGKFTEIATGLDNSLGTYITDPHPALDFARYRIVAISDATGSVSYCDLPGYPIMESAIIIQWDEAWRTFETYDGLQVERAWSGSLLRLPYNIDVSEDFNIDASLVEYIGRENPVSYYGTQRGYSSTWNVEIPKHDKETLYGLRRLANWMGDVYVREPSGTGYWARIKPSFNVKHLAVVIPITLNITRVEGGA